MKIFISIFLLPLACFGNYYVGFQDMTNYCQPQFSNATVTISNNFTVAISNNFVVLSNLNYTTSTNATNFALSVGLNGSNYTASAVTIASTNATNYANTIGANSTNYSLGLSVANGNYINSTVAALHTNFWNVGLFTNGSVIIGDTNLIGGAISNKNYIWLGLNTNAQGKIFVSSNGTWFPK